MKALHLFGMVLLAAVGFPLPALSGPAGSSQAGVPTSATVALTLTNAVVTRYQYGTDGNLLFQIDALNRTNAYTYDAASRLLTHTLPLGRAATNQYDVRGNLTNHTDFNGYHTTSLYDEQDRLRYRLPDPRLNEVGCAFTYTPMGRRESMQDASGLTLYFYNERGALKEKITPHGTLFYRYDAAGNLTNLASSHPHGVQLSYTWDPLNRLDSVVHPVNGTTQYRYHTTGLLKEVLYPNQVSHVHLYDSLNRLTNVTVTGSNGVLARFSYALNAGGQRRQLSETIGLAPPIASTEYNWEYDSLNRLTNELCAGSLSFSSRYRYDPVGNRLERRSTHPLLPELPNEVDANDRLRAADFDENGNTRLTDDTFYQYDYENRLIFARTPTNDIQIVYDGDGNRVRKTVNNITTYYLVDDQNPTGYAQVLEELMVIPGSTNLEVDRVQTYGHALISQDQRQGVTTTSFFYGYDGHGSVRFLIEPAGEISDTYHYDAYGTHLRRTGTHSNNYLYTGEQYDPDLGFYYLRARYLNTVTGRFLTMDTAEGTRMDPLSLHKYAYATCSPTMFIDPTGHMSIGERINVMAIQTIMWTTSATRTARAFRWGMSILNAIAFIQDPGTYVSMGPLGGAEIIVSDIAALGRAGGQVFRATRSAWSARNAIKTLQGFRTDLGIPQLSEAGGQKTTTALLEIDDGIWIGSRHVGRSPNDRSTLHPSLRPNAQTGTHAEANVFSKAAWAGSKSKRATLHVDRELCKACGQNGGVKSMARSLGIKELTVLTPGGKTVIVIDPSINPAPGIPSPTGLMIELLQSDGN